MTRKILAILIMVLLIPSCSPTEIQDIEQATIEEITPEPTFTTAPTATQSPSPTFTPTSTPIPPELSEAARQTYLAMLFIQIDAELIKEAAVRTQSGELSGVDQFGALLAIAALMEGVDQSLPDISPPESLQEYWSEITEIHEQTKGIMRDWFNEEINSSDVVEEISPLLSSLEQQLSRVENSLADEFNFDVNEITQAREEILESVPEIFNSTPTPTQ